MQRQRTEPKAVAASMRTPVTSQLQPRNLIFGEAPLRAILLYRLTRLNTCEHV
jgi:hypothetical protein